MREYSYDEECEKLAEHFLAAGDDRYTCEDRRRLAQEIQDAVERWLTLWENENEAQERP